MVDIAAARSITHLSGLISPQLLASEQYVELDGPLAEIFPSRRVQRGSVILFEGAMSSGLTSVVFEFLASKEIQRGWCALVGFENVGFLSAFEKGVDLGKVVSISDPGKNLAQVIAVLMEAFPVTVVANPGSVSPSQARNLVSRLRSRRGILAVVQQNIAISKLQGKGLWAGSSDYVVRSSLSSCDGLGKGNGFIKRRSSQVSLEARRAGGAVKITTVVL